MNEQQLITPFGEKKKQKVATDLLNSLTHTIITQYVIANDVGYNDFFTVLWRGRNRPQSK